MMQPNHSAIPLHWLEKLIAIKQRKTSEINRRFGSPGRARTYNNSVNSRVLCH